VSGGFLLMRELGGIGRGAGVGRGWGVWWVSSHLRVGWYWMGRVGRGWGVWWVSAHLKIGWFWVGRGWGVWWVSGHMNNESRMVLGGVDGAKVKCTSRETALVLL
jgi:hypothetical protein